jgi:hypothetical protein
VDLQLPAVDCAVQRMLELQAADGGARIASSKTS